MYPISSTNIVWNLYHVQPRERASQNQEPRMALLVLIMPTSWGLPNDYTQIKLLAESCLIEPILGCI